jgi:hypothetical protein
MSQSQDSISKKRTTLRLTAVVVSSLLFSVAATASSLGMAAESVRSGRRVQVTCDCRENQPAGTLITRLGDHNLTLKNFRAAESPNQSQFTVDAGSGAICTMHDDQMDFESQREFQFRVLADEESERDEFLAEFSASLVDSGLPADDLKSLSVATVIFDITVRLCDVPESPELLDSYFSIQLANNSPAEVGCIKSHSQPVSADWQYYIASGNEDGIFQMNPGTGFLTLLCDDSCQSDMMADFDLEVLAENLAGEFRTAHVFVNIFRESPVSVSESNPSTANMLEENPEAHSVEISTVLIQNEITEPTAETSDSPEQPINADGEPTGPSSVNTLPNINAIDVTEVQQWVTDTVGVNSIPQANLPPVNSDVVSSSSNTKPVSTPPIQMSFQDSRGDLVSIGAFFIFLVAGIATVMIWSRAATSRAKVLQDEASAERLQSALNRIQQDEEIRLLKSQLADRDQTIAQLKKELHSITQEFQSGDVTDDDLEFQGNQDSSDSREPKPSSASQFISAVLHVPSLQHRDSTADVRASLGAAVEQIGHELTRQTQDVQFLTPSDELSAEFLCESAESAVATLDAPQDLRSELADLFKMHAVEETDTSMESSDSNFEVDLESGTASADQHPQAEQFKTSQQQEVTEKDEQASEDLHLDSVKLYLSKLLERSQDATSPEAILMDRRKTTESHRGADRRDKPENSRPPVKSYLDDYMSAHGGELEEIVGTGAAPSSKATPAVTAGPLKPRPPVDVHSIREAMNAFRVVSIQSSESALLSHVLRQAEAKIAWRTVMIAGLVGITVLIFLANMKHVIDFGSLNWLMSSLVVLSLAELCLRIYAVMRQRRSVTSSVLPPHPVTQIKRQLSADDSISKNPLSAV